MLKFFQSIFGNKTTTGSYSESLVKAAIERAVDGTAPWIRAVSGYKRKLRPAVVRAIDHVVALVDGMAPAIIVTPGSYGSDPLLRTFFISNTDMWEIIDSDRNLIDFQQRKAMALPQVFALLTMEKHEKIVLGAELSGNIVQRDVPQIVVSYEAHKLIDPAASDDETRRQLKRRTFDHLLSLALRHIAIVKTERDNLERHRTLLQAKLNLLRRGEWGFDRSATDDRLDVAGAEESLARIEEQLLELGGDDRMLELYLGIVIDVIGRPEEHLWIRKETFFVDHMGIKRSEAVDNAQEVTLDLICDSEERSLAIALVAISVDVIQNSSRA